MAEQPVADPARVLSAWEEWEVGDVLPGQAMANLKKAGLPEVLASTITALQQAGTDAGAVGRMIDEWNRWERGGVAPTGVLELLRDEGLKGLLERARDAQQEVFGTP